MVNRKLFFGCIFGLLAVCKHSIATPGDNTHDDDPEIDEYHKICRNHCNKFTMKHYDLTDAFLAWKPAGNNLIYNLRDAADRLDSNQHTTDTTELFGGFATLVGGAMALFPPTMPFGVALTIGGLGGGMGASWVNSRASNWIQEQVNNMISNQKFGYQRLQRVTDEYQNIIPDMAKCLEYGEYRKFPEETNKDVPFREFSDKNEQSKTKQDFGKFQENDRGNLDTIYNAGKVAAIAANTERLVKVAPYIKYAGFSNRALKAKMIKDAVDAAQIAKVSGVTGAAGKAYRLSEINKATNAIKAAKAGVKAGGWAITLTALGCAFSIYDIAVNINDLANGSVSPESKNYRAIADDLEKLIRSEEKLLGINVHDYCREFF